MQAGLDTGWQAIPITCPTAEAVTWVGTSIRAAATEK